MRISAISYLNTAPLMWDFEHGLTDPSFEVSYTIPSQCALQLSDGTADIGIIPSAAYASIPDLSILPGIAIASKKAVRSILLVSKRPLDQVRSVALDNSSLTSVALTRVLFEKFWGGPRDYRSQSPNLEIMLAANDAALLIGDPALKVDCSKYQTWDLAEEWIRFTGKPFVFAFWAVRDEALRTSRFDLTSIFQASRDHGLGEHNLRRIVQTWAEKLNLSAANVHEYLTSNIFYYLDEACLDGLRRFYRLAQECGALPAAPELTFAAAPATV
ncbi:MAG TPA: menaquinone biosynthesis protein [Terriglobales bacterium]|nr:menaquinone biosynthesis protein [Terriglobales bacterium]